MKRTREEMKRELMVRAEDVVDQFLDWNGDRSKATLTEIEGVILRLRQELGEEMASMVLATREENTPVSGAACPRCGREMHYKGQKKDIVESRVGTLEVRRGYYHCAECEQGSFPPGSATGLEG